MSPTAKTRWANPRPWASRRSCWASRRLWPCRMRWRPVAMDQSTRRWTPRRRPSGCCAAVQRVRGAMFDLDALRAAVARTGPGGARGDRRRAWDPPRARWGRRCWSGRAGSRAPSAAARWNGRRSAAPAPCWPRAARGWTARRWGPKLGQCCGGAVTLLTEVYGAPDLAALDRAEIIARPVDRRGGSDAPGGQTAAGAGARPGRDAGTAAGAGLDGGAGGPAAAAGVDLGRGPCRPRAGGGAGPPAGAGDHLGRCGAGPVSRHAARRGHACCRWQTRRALVPPCAPRRPSI